jgi:hypothetical protein
MRKPLVDKILHLLCRKTRCDTRCMSMEVTAIHYYSDFSRTNPTGCAAAEELLGVVRKKLSYPRKISLAYFLRCLSRTE